MHNPTLAIAAALPTTAEPSAPPVYGNNPLIIEANELLTLMSYIDKTIAPHDVNQLKKQLINALEKFQVNLELIRFDRKLITAAHYCLCVAIDEAVFKKEWGKNSAWVNESLLSHFHKETWGGERFYIILRNAMENVKTHISLLELIYLCLSLGFEGQYYGQEQIIKEEIRNKVFYYIHRYYGKKSKLLSPHWQDNQLLNIHKQKKKSLKKRAIRSLSFFIILIGMFNTSAYHQSKTTIHRLNSLATEAPVTVFNQLTQRY